MRKNQEGTKLQSIELPGCKPQVHLHHTVGEVAHEAWGLLGTDDARSDGTRLGAGCPRSGRLPEWNPFRSKSKFRHDSDPGTGERAASHARRGHGRQSHYPQLRTVASSVFVGSAGWAKATLEIRTMTWPNRRVLVMDDFQDLSKSMKQKVDGILGEDVLREFDSVVIDFKHHRLVLLH